MQNASYQQTNRYAVVGDMAIHFYLILLKRNRVFSRTRNRVSYAPSCLKRMVFCPERMINASYVLLLLNDYGALSRSWRVFIPKHFINAALLCCRKRGGRNGLPIRREQIEKG